MPCIALMPMWKSQPIHSIVLPETVKRGPSGIITMGDMRAAIPSGM